MNLREKFIAWLTKEPPPVEQPPCDFNRLKLEIRPGDVLLIEGRSRISQFIRTITQSPWTHSALYIGRADDIEDEELRKLIAEKRPQDENDQKRLIIEGVMDKGTIISTLHSYHKQHIRICRPIGLAPADAQLVIGYAIKAVGQPYNVKQIFDLLRFLLPWSILPRRWGSSLFTTPSGEPESGICSSLIAEAFISVKFPILPFLIPGIDESASQLVQRNPYIFTPKDFDYSPYFQIIKYPVFSMEAQLPYYRRLPWTDKDIMHQGKGEMVGPKKKKKIVEKDNPANPQDEGTS